MVVLNTYEQETVWWQTALHLLVFLPLVVLTAFIIGLIQVVSLGQEVASGLWSYLVVSATSTYSALLLPTIIFSKSNESVVSTIVGTIYALVLAVMIFAVISIEPNYLAGETRWASFKQLAACAVSLIATICFFFRNRR